MISSDF